MGAVAAFFAKPLVKYGAVALAALVLIAGTALYLRGVERKGEKAGAAKVIDKVQTETIKKIEGARIEKEKADADVRATPYDDRADGLR